MTPRRRLHPKISVIVPTYCRPRRLATLLGQLQEQTLPVEEFEVIVVDDGSPSPQLPSTNHFPLNLCVIRQANAGPASARNRALAIAQADRVLFLNDDAEAAPDLLQEHLAAHASQEQPVAVLGTFEFKESCLTSPFVQILADSKLLFDYPGLTDGGMHPWSFFWTCNISVSTTAVRQAGGFDSTHFKQAMYEDLELGYRLAKRGLHVLHHASAKSWHNHSLTLAEYRRRAFSLGIHYTRMAQKHNLPLLGIQPGASRATTIDTLNKHLSGSQLNEEAVEAMLQRVETAFQGKSVPRDLMPDLRRSVDMLNTLGLYRGVVHELSANPPPSTRAALAPA